MAGPKKFIALVAGRQAQIASVVTSGGSSNDGDLVALDATGKLDASVLPAGVGVNTQSAVCSESIAAGALINFWNNAGTLNMRNADATSVGKEAQGFTKGAFSSGATGVGYLPGNTVTGLTGMTIGARQYLGKTAGVRVEDVTGYTAGNVVQYVGTAVTATSFIFNPSDSITV